MADMELTCGDCGQPFNFPEKDQAFYQEKGYSQPKRCKNCREKRKADKGRQ